ncbi:MAG: hypothetical protein WA687_09420 [Solirubrobacterales bacterium]
MRSVRDRHTKLALLLAIVSIAAIAASPARAAIGYEPDATKLSLALAGAPRGIAIDPTTQDIYVAILSTDLSAQAPGQINRFNSDLSADGVFAAGNGFYSGVAFNPLTSGFYGAQMKIESPFGTFGTSKLDRFSSSGALSGSSVLPYTASLPDIATDSVGNVFYPNVSTHSVQIFNSSGVLVEEVICGGCPGGAFGNPASVALTSTDDLYVADVNPDRVVKLTRSGGSYAFASTLQSGRGAGAVAVDPATGDVLVGDMPGGMGYHIVAYDSSGTQYDDFAGGLLPNAQAGAGTLAAYQLAVNGATHKLYVVGTNKLLVFEKTTIDPPTAAIKPASAVGQITATLKATVNANGHAVLECKFEYTNEADFQTNGFTNATELPCPTKPDGLGNSALEVKAPGLDPATDYRYRVTATSYAGSVSSGSAMFETLPEVAPTATTESPLPVTATTATLRGKVNPLGGSVADCHFDFGVSVSYGSSLSCAVPPGTATTDVAESAAASGLLPSTTYHYRLVITTNAGTAEGDDVEFTAATPPPPLEPEPAPATAVPQSPVSAPPAPPSPPPCGKGFRRRTIDGRSRCVRICRKGFRRKRIRDKVKCVRIPRSSRPRRGGTGR